MPTPENPPIEPTWLDCTWAGPLNAKFGITIWDVAPGDVPQCPPTVGGSPISGMGGFTFRCTSSGGEVSCWDPDIADQLAEYAANGNSGDIAVSAPPTCVRSWGSVECDDLNDIVTWPAECATCPPGYTLNPDDCLCYTGDPCPPGTCYCDETADCLSCDSLPLCEGLYDCFWDREACQFQCQGTGCGPDETYDYIECECVPRCPGLNECWCEIVDECVDCTFDRGPDQYDCEWNTATCEWECSECPEGECWCETVEGGSCVPCSPIPECFEALHCEWNFDTCEWVCDDPDTICGPNREWVGSPECRCEGSGGVWNLHTPIGHYHVATDLDGITYYRANDTVPPFDLTVEVTSDTTDRSPRMVRDDWGRLLLIWLRGSNVYESLSDDEGESWEEPENTRMAVTQVTIAKDRMTGMVMRGYLVDNALVVTRQYPGEDAEGDDVEAVVNPGGLPLELDDAGFHFSKAPEGPGRWLLVGVSSGDAKNWASADDGATWELVS